jgi:hypothetical protein
MSNCSEPRPGVANHQRASTRDKDPFGGSEDRIRIRRQRHEGRSADREPRARPATIYLRRRARWSKRSRPRCSERSPCCNTSQLDTMNTWIVAPLWIVAPCRTASMEAPGRPLSSAPWRQRLCRCSHERDRKDNELWQLQTNIRRAPKADLHTRCALVVAERGLTEKQ